MYSIFLKLTDLAETSPAKHDHIVFWGLVFAALLNLSLWLIVFLAFGGSSEYIILQYNIYFGISSFGSWYRLLLLPFFGVIVFLADAYLAFSLYLEYRLLSRFLAISAVAFNLILISATILLIYMNM